MAYPSEKKELFYNDPQMQTIGQSFREFHELVSRLDVMEVSAKEGSNRQKQILTVSVPQLLFMNESFFPPGIPKAVCEKLLLECGKEMSLIQDAITLFNDGLSLFFDSIQLLQRRMEETSSETNGYFMQNVKQLHKPATFSLRGKSSVRGVPFIQLYMSHLPLLLSIVSPTSP